MPSSIQIRKYAYHVSSPTSPPAPAWTPAQVCWGWGWILWRLLTLSRCQRSRWLLDPHGNRCPLVVLILLFTNLCFLWPGRAGFLFCPIIPLHFSPPWLIPGHQNSLGTLRSSPGRQVRGVGGGDYKFRQTFICTGPQKEDPSPSCSHKEWSPADDDIPDHWGPGGRQDITDGDTGWGSRPVVR